ncbi:MAG: hypothetical protein QOH21_923 [Acidobacteriota bacterium]|jgi:hypothetical protein|nr:hypothetical protein [Acidobacteriota bacterium]
MMVGMRRALLTLATTLALTACGTSSDPQQTPGPALGIAIRQINGSANVYRYATRVALQYIVTVTNPTDQEYRIESVEVRTPVAGAYGIREGNSMRIDRTLPPKTGTHVPVNTWGYAEGGRLQAEEPVTITVAVFGRGPDNKTFVKRTQRVITNFNEPGDDE